MGNTGNQIKKAMEIDGAIAAAIVDSESGMTLASAGTQVSPDSHERACLRA